MNICKLTAGALAALTVLPAMYSLPAAAKAPPENGSLSGDVNGDGVFDTADAALLQCYLTGVPETYLADWTAADLNGDNILDASDLSLMKAELLTEQPVDFTVLEQEWVAADSDAVHASLCETAASMDALLAVLASAGDTAPLPAELDDAFFEEYTAVVLYSSLFPGYRKITVDSVTSALNTLHVTVTSRLPMETIPDTRSCRTIIAVPRTGITGASQTLHFLPYWADEDADNIPEIVDAYGDITEPEKQYIYEQLLQSVLLHDTKPDFRDFTFVYDPEHPLKKYVRSNCFYIYYKGILLHGYGDLSTDDNAYASANGINFIADPTAYSAVDLDAEILSAEDVKALYPDMTHDPELILYACSFYDTPPMLAYQLVDNPEYGESIIDAVTGEEIEYIPYYICVLPVEYV